MKSAWLVIRLLTTDGAEVARAEIPLADVAPANVNSACRYQAEASLEQRETIVTADAPYWDVRI